MWRCLWLAVFMLGCRKAPRSGPGATGAGRAPDAEVIGAPAYASFAEVAAAGKAAQGKLALLELRRVVVRPLELVAVPCPGQFNDLVFLGFTAEQRGLVRALPIDEDGYPDRAPEGGADGGLTGCARVLVRVVSVGAPGFHSEPNEQGELVVKVDSGTVVEARALEFPGLTARPASAPPAGADYGDLDELGFAGAAASGRIAEISARLEAYAGLLSLRPCGRPGVINLRPAPGATPPTPHRDCRPWRFRVSYSDFIMSPRQLKIHAEGLP
ncbi:MAG: hypothetical protein IT370_13325 [Deltaproteobacteria bacterium]|nr:hypothetical protein [Deltaproteobacteria bacterium]